MQTCHQGNTCVKMHADQAANAQHCIGENAGDFAQDLYVYTGVGMRWLQWAPISSSTVV